MCECACALILQNIKNNIKNDVDVGIIYFMYKSLFIKCNICVSLCLLVFVTKISNLVLSLFSWIIVGSGISERGKVS